MLNGLKKLVSLLITLNKNYETNYKLQITNYKLQITNYKLQITNYKFLILFIFCIFNAYSQCNEPVGFGPIIKLGYLGNTTFPKINQRIYALPGNYNGSNPAPVQGYLFEITTVGYDPNSPLYSGQIGVYETTNNYFRLSDVTFVDNNTPNPITYVKPGGTYNIRLKVKRNGQYSCWGFYNLDPTTLNIPQAGTPYFYIKAVDSPRILNSNKPSVPCGGTFPDRDLTQIEAKNSVQIPTLNNFTYFTPYNYRWRVTREDDGLVTEFNSPTNLILFKTLVTYNPLGIGLDTPEGWQFIKPNKTYKFEIGALYPDGTKHFSQYGICYFKTANFPLRPANTTNTTEKEDNVTKVFEAQAYPNPSANSFMINIQSSSKEKITIAVYNNVGLLIDTKVVASDFPTQEIGANYNKGFYTVIVSQGDTVKKLKLIKQ